MPKIREDLGQFILRTGAGSFCERKSTRQKRRPRSSRQKRKKKEKRSNQEKVRCFHFICKLFLKW
eukprot:UN23816